MNAIMNDTHLSTFDEVEAFLTGTEAVEFTFPDATVRYAWLQATLIRFGYAKLSRRQKGLLRHYLRRVTGYSRQQLTRLVARYLKTGKVQKTLYTRHSFPRRYTREDIRLVAHTDEWHGTLNGAATKKILERQFLIYSQPEYERLASISIAHLYNLRGHTAYIRQRGQFDKTRPAKVAIADRRKPQPQGRPGYLRVDSVHQGDWDGIKGVYHINAVDEVTQFECLGCAERISEAYLLPVLETLLEAFPFVILGFHADNGSEYINHRVAKLLNKLLIEFTKSRSRKTNDNALVEGKNGAVVRKHFGYAHIPQHYAPLINAFNRDYLNPYLNYHRPCFFPQVTFDDQGKQRKRYLYKAMMTPYEKLKSLPQAAQYLKPGVNFENLDAYALCMSDNEAASKLCEARKALFKTIFEQNAA
jgi:transposase InsO family protein